MKSEQRSTDLKYPPLLRNQVENSDELWVQGYRFNNKAKKGAYFQLTHAQVCLIPNLRDALSSWDSLQCARARSLHAVAYALVRASRLSTWTSSEATASTTGPRRVPGSS